MDIHLTQIFPKHCSKVVQTVCSDGFQKFAGTVGIPFQELLEAR